MKRYRVLLSQTVIEEAWVTVEAENEIEAQARAYEQAVDGEVSFHFADTFDVGVEAIEIEEVHGDA